MSEPTGTYNHERIAVSVFNTNTKIKIRNEVANLTNLLKSGMATKEEIQNSIKRLAVISDSLTEGAVI